MKRFFAFLGIIALSINCFYLSAFSATSLKITSAEPTNENSFIEVKGNISGVSDGQQVTVLATELLDGTYDKNNIVYINQMGYTDTDGNFTFLFGVKGTLNPNKSYIVRIGGDGLSAPAALIVGTNGQGEIDFIYGDANSDGVIDASDASLVLQYVLDKDSVDEKFTSVENFNEKINVTGEEYVSAKDASCILQKSIKNNDFVFPIENKNLK